MLLFLLPAVLDAHLVFTNALARLPIAPEPRAVRLDADGNPIPPDALCRLGSARFRHPAPVDYIAFAPNGKTIAVAHVGGVTIWETATGKRIRRIEWHTGRVRRVAFAPDGRAVNIIAEILQNKCVLLTVDSATGAE